MASLHSDDFIRDLDRPHYREIVIGLLGAALDSADSPLITTDWQDLDLLLACFAKDRIAGLVADLVDRGVMVVPSDTNEHLRRARHEIAVHQLQLRDLARRVTTAFDDEGIDVRTLKGLATADLDYAIPATRHTADVDLIVRKDDFPRAKELVAAIGAQELKSDAPTDLLVESTFETEAGLQVDLHHRLFRFGAPNEDLVFAGPLAIGTGLAPAMTVELRLLHAAAHYVIAPRDDRRLSSLIDVAALLPKVDRSMVANHASKFGVHELVDFAIWLVEDLTTGEAPPPPKPKTLIGRAYIREQRRPDLETLAVLADLRRPTDMVRYLSYQLKRQVL